MSTVITSEAQREWDTLIAMAYRPMRERDPELVRKACEEMDAAREELRKRIGIVDVAVELIRAARQ